MVRRCGGVLDLGRRMVRMVVVGDGEGVVAEEVGMVVAVAEEVVAEEEAVAAVAARYRMIETGAPIVPRTIQVDLHSRLSLAFYTL